MGRLHREQNPLCPEWGASTSPCVLKAGAETLCTPFPGGQENISGCVSPGVRSISLSDRPPTPFPSLLFIPGTIVRASSFGLLHIPCQKQKPFLTPMTRPVVILSGMWRPPGVGGEVGGMHASNLCSACQLHGEQGLGQKRLQGAGSPEPPDFKTESRTTAQGPRPA